MMICLDCGRTFAEEEAKTISEIVGEFWGAPASREYSVCPYCGSDVYEDAVQCDLCGEWMAEEDVVNDKGRTVCEVCIDRVGKLHRERPDEKLTEDEEIALRLYEEAW